VIRENLSAPFLAIAEADCPDYKYSTGTPMRFRNRLWVFCWGILGVFVRELGKKIEGHR